MFGAPLAVWRGRAEAKGWQVVESLCAFAMPAGKTVKKVYEAFRDEIVADLKAAMPVDGVFLSMHGAMVAEGYDDCESDILAHVRKVVGPGRAGRRRARPALQHRRGHLARRHRAGAVQGISACRRAGARRRSVHRDGRRHRGPHQAGDGGLGLPDDRRVPHHAPADARLRRQALGDGRQGRRAVAVDRPRLPVVRHQGDEQQDHRHHRRRQGQGREAGARARPGILRHARRPPSRPTSRSTRRWRA